MKEAKLPERDTKLPQKNKKLVAKQPQIDKIIKNNQSEMQKDAKRPTAINNHKQQQI